ncbi:MAG: hypothetical protein LBD29_01570 [Treponema sp.]|jgi:hypothetical protein|nr:hypothetical protein [Treponema sp.]
MRLFCLLWTPLLYLLWSSLRPERTVSGVAGILSLTLGSIAGLIAFFLGALVDPGGFGLSRWISGFVDIVSVPVLLPFIVFLILLPFKRTKDFAGFALLWLIPDISIRLVNWSVQNNPLFLVVVPLLRSGIALGIGFCISLIAVKKVLTVILGIVGIFALPLAGATCYWAFFSHQTGWGYICFAITLIPGLAWLSSLFFAEKNSL